jgi:hypothetical protein
MVASLKITGPGLPMLVASGNNNFNVKIIFWPFKKKQD